MEQLSTLDYLALGKWKKFVYNLKRFFCAVPGWFLDKLKKLGNFFVKLGLSIKDEAVFIGSTFKNGSVKTKVSYAVMGFNNLCHKQWLRAAMFLLMESLFIVYMALFGGAMIAKLGSLGTVAVVTEMVNVEIAPGIFEMVEQTRHVDNSFKILLYGLITIFFMVALVVTWRINVKQAATLDEIDKTGKPVKTSKDDLMSLVDNQFHKTMLALPIFGITMFTILPIIFMILVAFTNYDYQHNGYMNLFQWVGLQNFGEILQFGGGMQVAFGEILGWTMIWSLFATFSNYFLGMFVAMMINKKGIKIKKFWRTILVLTIAVPQFISLLYISNLFSDTGIINGVLLSLGITDKAIPFWTNGTLAKVMVIVINIWVGIPYLMLITTGILMNIPEDLYESSKIDGANAFQQFSKITLPYMLFVTGPYLLTSFVGNINNFNVIYLLTQGGPANPSWGNTGGYIAGDTTILITWLFGITTGDEANYKMAAVIGILIFAVCSILSLIVFGIMPSTRKEDDYS